MPSDKCVEQARARGAMIWMCGVVVIAAFIMINL
jgi:hypothetical protein